jgi:hypothetical protein
LINDKINKGKFIPNEIIGKLNGKKEYTIKTNLELTKKWVNKNKIIKE